MASSGSAFEREIAKALSLWLSGGEDDSWVWRTAASGGRSTVRFRKNKRTSGGAGDLMAVDTRAAPLFEHVTFELKRGYAKTGMADLIDRNLKNKPPEFEKWIAQAMRSASQAGTKHWMIVHKRNTRPAMAYLSYGAFKLFCGTEKSPGIELVRPQVSWRGVVRTEDKAVTNGRSVILFGVGFAEFLSHADPRKAGVLSR